MGSIQQDVFSMKEIGQLSFQQLSNMVFTFEKTVTTKNLNAEGSG